MSDKLKDFTLKLPKIFNTKKQTAIFFIIGLIGILIIGASELFSTNEKKSVSTNYESISIEEYTENLENKVVDMISAIHGAGKTKVMISLEATEEREYAIDKNTQENTQNSQDETQKRKDEQTEIVLIEGNDGKKKALITKTIQPKIKGVLVICQGADDVNVNECITSSISTLLGISSNKISIAKLKN